MTYTVSELSAKSPDMSDDDFAAFVEDIKTNGQLVPIWVRGSEVIDGRKRLAACQKIGVEPRVVNLDPALDAEAVARALNVLRTHYTNSQRTIYAAARVNATQGDARKLSITKNVDAGITTARRAAREAGVSVSGVILAKRVLREGAPQVAEAVRGGKLTVHAAHEIVTAVPLDDQPVAVERVIEASKGKRLHTPVAKILGSGGSGKKDKAQPKKPQEQFARAVQMMDVAAEIIAANADAASQDTRRTSFLETLRHVRTTLTRCINSLEIAA